MTVDDPRGLGPDLAVVLWSFAEPESRLAMERVAAAASQRQARLVVVAAAGEPLTGIDLRVARFCTADENPLINTWPRQRLRRPIAWLAEYRAQRADWPEPDRADWVPLAVQHLLDAHRERPLVAVAAFGPTAEQAARQFADLTGAAVQNVPADLPAWAAAVQAVSRGPS